MEVTKKKIDHQKKIVYQQTKITKVWIDIEGIHSQKSSCLCKTLFWGMKEGKIYERLCEALYS